MKEVIRKPAEPGYCHSPSNQYRQWLDEAMGDPRVVAGKYPDADWRTPYKSAPTAGRIRSTLKVLTRV